jgi:glycosyltransferase involved in cell wall biosynthesis
LSGSFKKYSPTRRLLTQRKYAGDVMRLIAEQKPDVVLSGNTPIDVQAELLWHCKRRGVGFVHWVQDVYCQAIEFFLRRKLRALAGPCSLPFRLLEKAVTSASDSTVVISPAFRNLLMSWGIPDTNITVLENWAPIEELNAFPRENAWSTEHELGNKIVFLYSGTLGLKHRPDLLYSLAQALDNSCRVVVITEGIGRKCLAELPQLENLSLLDFQPYDELPKVLASADVLVATLEPEAGEFAVPSKVLSYLCAGRPLLLAAPRANLAASVVERSGGGIVVEPNDTAAWVAAARKLAADPWYRQRLAKNARQYAEQTFDIQKIATAFEEVLINACVRPSLVPSGRTARA